MEVVDGSKLVLDRWPTNDAGWSQLIDSVNIPPAIVRRGVAFDHAEPLLAELSLPAGGDGMLVVRDVGCPECGRPVVVVYKPWANEPRKTIDQTITGGLEKIDWHSSHP